MEPSAARKNTSYVGRRTFVMLAGAALGSTALYGIVGPSAQALAEETGSALYTAGTYTAVAQGKKGPVTVEVAFSDDAIESVRVIDHDDTPRIAGVPFERIPQQIVEYQSLGIDTVTGATLSSIAVLNAVEDCVEQAGGDVAALRAVAGPEAQAETKQLNADVVVVGAGSSGMGAAIACAQKGASVVVLEKCANIGGNCLVSGGMIAYIEAPDAIRAEMTDGLRSYFETTLADAASKGFPQEHLDAVRKQYDDYYATGSTKAFNSVEFEAIYGLLVQYATTYSPEMYASVYRAKAESTELLDWLNEMPIEWHTPLLSIAGNPWPDWVHPKKGECGEGYFAAFDEYLAGDGAALALDILFSTPATELIVEDGVVAGVRGLCADGTAYEVHANTAVVLATGGFSGNRDLVVAHDDGWGWDRFDIIPTTNNYGHTGDGLLMAQALGAGYTAMGGSHFNVLPFANAVDHSVESLTGNSGNALLVNKEGMRFVNETLSRNEISKVLMEEPDMTAFLVSDANNAMITNGANMFGMPIDLLIENKKLYRADSVAELAEQLDIDPETLEASVATYNDYAAARMDPDFGRVIFDETSPVVQPPFYACPVSWAVHITLEGLTIDPESYAVLNEQEEPIPHLYAVGEVAANQAGIMNMSNGLVLAHHLFA